MRVPQNAKAILAVLALTALVAGCGGDSNAPDAPFDPEGLSADLSAIDATFDSPAASGFTAASASIRAVLGSSAAAAAVKAAPTREYLSGRKSAATRYSKLLAETYLEPAGGIHPSMAAMAVPEEYLGVTFTYDTETDAYGPSELAGAPADGVRFIIYAVNPISGVPIEPLVEVGYADIVTTQSTNAVTVRVEVVSDGVTYLDYSVAAAATETSVTLNISGYVSNGDDRVNYDLDNHLSNTSATVDYVLVIPTRGNFRIDFEGESNNSTATTSMEARGPHGTVTISGEENSESGSWEVEVNGELFATVTKTGDEEPVITGSDGDELTPAERTALIGIVAVFLGGFDFFEDLLDPIVSGA